MLQNPKPASGHPSTPARRRCFYDPKSSISRLTALLVLVLVSAGAVVAIPLAQYRERVNKGIAALELIRVTDADPPGSRDAPFDLRVARTLLPRAETVEWNGTSYKIDNSWLEEQFRKIQNPTISRDQRNTLLDETLEGLQGLQARLEEIDKARVSNLPDKGEMRERLANILQRSEYAKTVREESALKRVLRQLIEWIGKLFPKGRSLSPGAATMASRLAQVFVIGLALAAIAYAVWMFVPRFLSRRKGKRTRQPEARIVLGERLEPEQSAADLLAEAEALALAGDLRGAIRRGYIALLIELSDRKLLSLAQHKTNRDYLSAVSELQGLHENMKCLTNNFEQHWYGLVPPNENDWLAFRAGYKAALTAF